MKCTKDSESKVLSEEILVEQKWQTYFHKLLNEEENRDIVLGDLEHSESLQVFGYCRCINVEEVKHVISRLSGGRATDLDEIPMQFWKTTNKDSTEWLTKLFNIIFKIAKMLDEWRWVISKIVAITKLSSC